MSAKRLTNGISLVVMIQMYGSFSLKVFEIIFHWVINAPHAILVGEKRILFIALVYILF
jgi:hypothetical protein